MALHLVGETIDKTRSHYQAETGKLVQLMRGVYVGADDDIDATVLKHAVRIAKYLYPRAYLSAASAVLLGPTRDGRLFLSGRRNKRTRIRALEIIQNEVPKHPSLVAAVVDDGMGEFRIDVSSVRQRFLEAFRLRSEQAGSVDDAMREALAAHLIEEFGSPTAAADAVWTLARENEWYREGEYAERFLLRGPATSPVRNEMHLKNLALLKIAEPGDEQFRSVRAPAGPLGAHAQRQGRSSAPRGLPDSCQHGRVEGSRHGRRDRRHDSADEGGGRPDLAARASGLRTRRSSHNREDAGDCPNANRVA